jgi:hypothetical protein
MVALLLMNIALEAVRYINTMVALLLMNIALETVRHIDTMMALTNTGRGAVRCIDTTHGLDSTLVARGYVHYPIFSNWKCVGIGGD